MTTGATTRAAACATLALALALAVGLVLAGCGLPDTRGLIPARLRQRPVTHRPAAPHRTSGAPAAPGQATLLRFAAAFSNQSPPFEAARQHSLSRLSTGRLAAEVRSSAPLARLAAIRGLPSGARLIGTAAIARLAATGVGTEQGIVLVGERIQLADGSSETPLIELYRAALRLTRRGWRVTEFSPAE